MDAVSEPAGSWLVARYAPVSLFALKASFASSAVGTTLVVPTPYAVKMALVDAAFRRGDPDEDCAALLEALVGVAVRIAPPEAVVTHTFSKIRQEPKADKKKPDPPPYISNVAYRELAAQAGEWRWAFQVEAPGLEARLRELLPLIRYVGKRGSFIQYLGCETADEIGVEYTAPVSTALSMPERAHVVPLDDFGPEASLKVLSSFSPEKAKRDRHRVFVQTMVPLGRARTGPGFTEYRR